MAEDKVEPREINWRQLLPWTVLFQGFRVALDFNKLLLAAGGILAMALVWWVLSALFYYERPTWPGNYQADYGEEAWSRFKRDRERWTLMYAAAGPDQSKRLDAADLADTPAEWRILGAEAEQVDKELKGGKTEDAIRDEAHREKRTVLLKNAEGQNETAAVPEAVTLKALRLARAPDMRGGRMRTLPWFEYRGSNPFLLATGQVSRPWAEGHFLEWLLTEECPVLLEPLAKLLSPVIFFFNPHAGPWLRFYCLLLLLATVAIWSLFGGAITRIAAVQVARQEKLSAKEAITFTLRHYWSILTAPLAPLVLVAGIVVIMIIFFGLPQLVLGLGDLWSGLLWWAVIALGLLMALALVGLVGWPLMSATVSAEGADFWEAASRAYSYVYNAPWHYLFYGLVALVYGAVLVFFVGFMTSAAVYFAKWGVGLVQPERRDPAFLFVYAPTSFGWRNLLLQGAQIDGVPLVGRDGQIDSEAYARFVNDKPATQSDMQMTWYNKVGAVLVAFWLWLLFLLMLGFGYSYFWSAGTIIYLLMRRKVDDTEMDEVYLEEEDLEGSYGAVAPPATKPAAPSAAPAGGPSLQMVEAPTLRTPPPSPPPPAAAPQPEQPSGATATAPPPDGNAGTPPAGGAPA